MIKQLSLVLAFFIIINIKAQTPTLVKNDTSFFVSLTNEYYYTNGYICKTSLKGDLKTKAYGLFDNKYPGNGSSVSASAPFINCENKNSELIIDYKRNLLISDIIFYIDNNTGSIAPSNFHIKVFTSSSENGPWIEISKNSNGEYSNVSRYFKFYTYFDVSVHHKLAYEMLSYYKPLINSSSNTIINNKCITLTAAANGETYLWSTGETTRSIQVCNAGTYTCQVTNTSFTGNQDHTASISIDKIETQDDLPSPNGELYSIVKNGNTVYYGGDFNAVGPITGSGSGIDISSGIPNTLLPRVNGTIRSTIGDGNGGWYVGGVFTKVGNYAISNLAHIKSDNSVDTSFQPQPNGAVNSLLLNGSSFYVGGEFTNINGIVNNYLAKIDISNGNSILWSAQCNGIVRSLALVADQLVVGGDFTSLGGQTRNYLGTVDTTYVQASTWNPNPNNKVYKVYVNGLKLYIGGDFTTISALAKSYGAGYSIPAFTIDGYNFGANGRIHDFVVNNNILYTAGLFTTIGGATRNYIAALNPLNAIANSFNATADGIVRTLAISNGNIVVGGDFASIGGQARSRIAALNFRTGVATSWNPTIIGEKLINPNINTIATFGNTMYAGGTFYSVSALTRNNAAAIDATTGQILPWNPNTNGIVRAIAADNNNVYLGGDFTTVNGTVIKNRIAQVNATTGVATAWNPGSDNSVNALLLQGTSLYVGGNFATIGGASRAKIAALSTTSGSASAFNPISNGNVNALAISGDTLYVGGDFTTIGGQTRNRLASYQISTSTLLAFNPNVNATVSALAVNKSKLYVGGAFSLIGSTLRYNFAEIDVITGNATSLNTNVINGSSVNALAIQDSSVYSGGVYQYYNSGLPISNLATVKTQSGLIGYWQPQPDGIIRTLCVASDKIYVGGGFKQINSRFQPYFASLDVYISGNKPEVNSVTPLTTCAKTPISIKGKGFKAIESVKIGQTTVPFTIISDTVINIQPENTINGEVSVLNILGFGKGNQNLNVINLSTTKIEYTPPAALCTGTTKLLNAPFFDGATYQWKKNGVAISGATNSTFSVNSAGSYSLSTSLGSACKSDAPAVIISVESAPAVTISGPSKICWNGRAMFRASLAGGVWAPIDNTLLLASPQGLFRNGVKPASDNYKSGVSYTVSSKLGACTTKATKNVYVRNVIAPSVTISTLKSSIKVNESTTATATTNIVATGTWSSTNTLVSAIANTLNTKTATVKGLRVGSGANVVYFADDATTGCRNAGYLAYSVTAAASMVSVSTNSETSTSNTSLYPNPSNGKFILNSTEDVNSVKLIDISGRVIAVQPIAASITTIDFTGVSSGKYMLQITGDQVNEMQPIVIE